MSTFVGIPSYRDTWTPRTVESLLDHARGDVRVVVVLQSDDYSLKEKIKAKGAEVIRVPLDEAIGCLWPRWRAQQEWKGEDWYYQCDAHCGFANEWDFHFESMMEGIPTKSVLVGFPAPDGEMDKFEHHLNIVPMKKSGSFLWQLGGEAPVIKRHTRAVGISGGNMFGPGFLARDCPTHYGPGFESDQSLYSMKLWTSGYELVIAPRVLSDHHYYHGKDPDNELLWESFSKKWNLILRKEEERVLDGVVNGRMPHLLGNERTLGEWKEYSGIYWPEIRERKYYEEDALEYYASMSI